MRKVGIFSRKLLENIFHVQAHMGNKLSMIRTFCIVQRKRLLKISQLKTTVSILTEFTQNVELPNNELNILLTLAVINFNREMLNFLIIN